MKSVKWTMPFGMLSGVAYFTHVFLGQALWQEYDPITMDISSLTANGAPDAELLTIIATIYGVCFLIFVSGMTAKAQKEYHSITKTGYIIFLVMAITTVVGYNLFPLTGNKTEMNFQNMMHIVVTVLIVFTSIASFFFIGFGYFKKEELKTLGRICLAMAVLLIVFGSLNPIGMANNWNILGITERMVIFPLQIFVFFLSFVYTFDTKITKNNFV